MQVILLDEFNDERNNQRVNAERFGKCDKHESRELDAVARFGVPRNGLHGFFADEAYGEGGKHDAKGDSEPGSDGRNSFWGHEEKWEERFAVCAECAVNRGSFATRLKLGSFAKGLYARALNAARKNMSERMEKMNACMRPTKISRTIKGSGMT